MHNNYNSFIYMWINLKNGKKYIGSHFGDIKDSYIGSGIYFKRAYKKDKKLFVRKILEYCLCDNHHELCKIEAKWLHKYKVGQKEDYYNINECAGGGYNFGHLPEERVQEIVTNWAKGSQEWRKSRSEQELKEHYDNLSTSVREFWENAPMDYLKEHAQKVKDKYWERSDEEIVKHQNKCIKKLTEWRENETEEMKKDRINKMKITKKEKQLKTINNGIEMKMVSKKELPKYIKAGWDIGMLPNFARIGTTGRKFLNKNGITKAVLDADIDKYIKEGWLIGRHKVVREEKKTIHKDGNIKKVPTSELYLWLNDGWDVGMGKRRNYSRFYVHKDNVIKSIPREDLQKWIDDGWKRGRKY